MTLEESARGATYPWNSLEAIAEEWRRAKLPVVTKEDVERCLDCKAPECFNCIGGGTPESPGRPGKDFVLDEQIALYPMVDGYGHEWEISSEISLER